MPEHKAAVTDLSRYADDVADLAQPLLHRHVPMVRNAWPRWNYITAVVIDATVPAPTDNELAMIASFHDEYISRWYRPGWITHMRREHPFDVDGGANGRIFQRQRGGWSYRKRTWQSGFWPPFPESPTTLVAVMDHYQTFTSSVSSSWTRWKAEHADVFETVS